MMRCGRRRGHSFLPQAGIVVEDHDYCRVAAWRVAPSRRVAAAYGVAYVLCKWVFSNENVCAGRDVAVCQPLCGCVPATTRLCAGRYAARPCLPQ